jgi:hypothetical protein
LPTPCFFLVPSSTKTARAQTQVFRYQTVSNPKFNQSRKAGASKMTLTGQ